ncbi:MAG TPA: phosphoglucosamine mutase [bacterium]|nr:phosphoglucosamine mutase [bacterium]HPO82512.1 phosphoglucosamine mutase [bacterium]
MKKLFGTDGVRGVANLDLTPELALKVAKAGGYYLGAGSDKPCFLVGRDTRCSGDMIAGAVIAGLCSVGVDVIDIGILPTPGIAYLTRKLKVNAGIVISASHNPIEDNGIKFFDSNGYKLSDEMEEDIEQLLDMDLPRPNGVKIGKVKVLPDAYELYVDYLIDQVGIRLDGLRVVLDCAYGAAYKVAPLVYRSLGADVISINDIPLGEKINVNCGSTHPGIIREEIRKYPGSIGISFDGDSDRVVLVDEEGNILDGDNILAIWGIELFRGEKLRNNTVVGTILSNMGLEIALLKYGIRLVRSDVGDRYVLEEMFRNNAVIGGEPSGHIIYLPGVTTGDGIYTSLMILKILKETGRTLSSFKDIMIRYPQISRNIKVKDKIGILEDIHMKNLKEYLNIILAGRGRFIIRPSGTEPYLRIMLEGEDEKSLERLMEEITGKVREIDNAYL